MAYKADWYKGATYTYFATPNDMGFYMIKFSVPNAATGPLEWEDWLYEDTDDGRITNDTAAILQCFIDSIGELSK